MTSLSQQQCCWEVKIIEKRGLRRQHSAYYNTQKTIVFNKNEPFVVTPSFPQPAWFLSRPGRAAVHAIATPRQEEEEVEKKKAAHQQTKPRGALTRNAPLPTDIMSTAGAEIALVLRNNNACSGKKTYRRAIGFRCVRVYRGCRLTNNEQHTTACDDASRMMQHKLRT